MEYVKSKKRAAQPSENIMRAIPARAAIPNSALASLMLGNSSSSLETPDVIQGAWDDTMVSPRSGISAFERPIPEAADAKLAQAFEIIQEKYFDPAKNTFLYIATGTANASANSTNPSFSKHTTKEALEEQQNPKITLDALKKGYRVITVNIDQFGGDKEVVTEGGNRIDITINGGFPVSGKVKSSDDKEEDSKAIPAMKALIGKVTAQGGEAVFLNAIEDTPSTDEPDAFRLFSGMRMLIPPKTLNFTYATSYLEDRPGFNLYKYMMTNRLMKKDMFIRNKDVPFESMDELVM